MTRPLPSSLTNLYRLFLRTSSASVLHQSLAKRNLRSLWRPVFADAAQVMKRLQTSQITPHERAALENWLRIWEERMDRTLSLLYVSATSRGLPHQLSSNLSQLFYAEYDRMTNRKHPTWNAQLALNAREYHPEIAAMEMTPRAWNKEEKARQAQRLDECSWNAIGLAVGMAEGRDRLSLGRIITRGKIWQN